MSALDPQARSGAAFGLRIAGELVIPSLRPLPSDPPARRLRTEHAPRVHLDRDFRNGAWDRIFERTLTDGRVGMSVDRSADGTFRIWAPRHGSYHVSADGTRLTGAPPSGPVWRWERLVLAQALPLAAVLQGLEVLHASAVAVDGQVIAFSGSPGAGKTSTALHAVAAGASLVTDDVLAMELRHGRPCAHPGPATIRADPAQLRGIPPVVRRRLGTVVARAEKCHLAVRTSATALPLGVIFQIVRPADVDSIVIEEPDPPDPLPVLGNAFLTYLQDPLRLTRQLDMCAAILAHARVRIVRVPADVSAGELARRLLQGIDER